MKELTADQVIGKRAIVSIRHISETGEYFEEYWGIIHAIKEDLIIKVEGGSKNNYEYLPADLGAFSYSEHEFYQLSNFAPITDVDFEIMWSKYHNQALYDAHSI